LNVHLVHVPLPLLDYVVLHELSHLKHMNHSAAFWNCVAQGMPDYVQRKEQLKKVVMPLWV
jgi:predicted metal-dependent hydrolase